MPKRESLLLAVTARVRAAQDAYVRLQEEADQWVRSQMDIEDKEVESAVMAALNDGHSIAEVARAYTVSGKTPNRNKIYEIKKANSDRISTWVGEYPFAWLPRTVRTRDGDRRVYDVVAHMTEFGPEAVTGEFLWRYEQETGEVEPILDVERDPYPTGKYYRQVLAKWLAGNPYPEED